MNCPSCGTENPPEASYCITCGARVAPSPDDSQPSQEAFPTSASFVGRRRELAQLQEAMDRALSGQGRLVMLLGESGIGKTRMVEELAALAETRGARVLWGRCYEEQGMPPFWPWVQLVRSYARDRRAEDLLQDLGPGAAIIGEMVPDVKEKLPDLKPPPTMDSPEQARFRLFDSISLFLKTAARRQPLVLILDDLHWADHPSLLLLQFVTREMGQDRLLLVGTYRDVELSRQHPLAETLGELTRDRMFQRVLLRGLSQAEVSRYIEVTTGAAPPATLVAAVFTQTEGNPLFVIEVVRLLVQEETLSQFSPVGPEDHSSSNTGGASWSLRIPEGVREVIGRRLNRLSAECNEILSVAAIIGREFTLAQLDALFGDMTEDRLLELLEEAMEARVVEELYQEIGRFQFSHSLVQETLAAELNLTRRVRLHARIALALEGLYQDRLDEHAAELAHHFQAAETVTGVDKVARYARLAGEQALAAYAYEDALAFFQMGLFAKEISLEGDQPAPDADGAALLFGLSRAQAFTYSRLRMPEAFQVLNRAFDFYEAVGAVEEAVAVAGFFIPVMSSIGASRNTPRALALVPEDSLAAARLLSQYGFVLGHVEGGYAQAQDSFARALAIARREKDIGLEIHTGYFSARMELYHCRWQSSLEQSLHVNELIVTTHQQQTEAQNLITACGAQGVMGDLTGSRQHAAAVLATATTIRDLASLVTGNWIVEWISLLEGNWPDGLEHSTRGLGLVPEDPRSLASRVLREYHLGKFAEGEIYLERFLAAMAAADSTLTRGVGLAIPMAFPFVSLAITIANDATQAGPLIRLIKTFQDTTGTPWGRLLVHTTLGILASLQSEREVAWEQYKHLGLVKGTFAPLALSGDRLLGVLAVTFGDVEGAARHFEDATEYCRRVGARPELAWAYYNHADVLVQRGAPEDRSRAKELLEMSLSLATDLGMPPLVERVQERLVQLDSGTTPAPTFPGGLTQREVEVLRLVAAGKSNPEIGGELVISVRTVANHVASILNKTNTNNRAEAASFATRHGLD